MMCCCTNEYKPIDTTNNQTVDDPFTAFVLIKLLTEWDELNEKIKEVQDEKMY